MPRPSVYASLRRGELGGDSFTLRRKEMNHGDTETQSGEGEDALSPPCLRASVVHSPYFVNL